MNQNFQIVVPFYNDYENFLKFIDIIEDYDIPKETFLLVDNGSEKNQIVKFYEESSKENNSWKAVKSDENLGFGGGVKYGASVAEKEYIAWMPGNLKLNPIDVYNFCNKFHLNNKKILIKANRKGRPKIDTLKTRIFGIIVSIFYGINLNDAGGTPNIVHSNFFNKIKEIPNDFTFDVFVLYYYRKNKLEVIRPEITYTKRLYGSSHWQTGIIAELKLLFDVFKSRNNWYKLSKIKIEDI
tara:strand:+ start:222 stop:941 length:720 start_codon:yes stop_codon:yes gene_type:complete